ncbi:NBAS [Acanthosepion pharaonis]|uniref:NBAS n=1 Tax=Acanthosepion pharaonis TaxID=158019 RepID=A0A812BIK7_ACAPH|nr:NBAS [Sepia pharaonis]
MASFKDDTNEKNILYNLTVHAEWKLDTEVFNRTQKDSRELTLWKKITLTSYRSFWNFLRNIGLRLPFNSGPLWDLPPGFVHIVNCQLAWNIAVGRCGQLVAILQDQFVEIRSSRDDYSSVFSRAVILCDHYPQWRQIAWSTDGALLAISHSSGTVQVFDTFGTHLFDIPSVSIFKLSVYIE